MNSMTKTEIVKNNSIQEINIIRILKTFTGDEMREFGKFVNSPFHNNRSEVRRYFSEIKRFYPSFQQSNFSKEEIFSRIHPDKKYRDDVIRRLSSNLFRLAE